VTTNRIFRDRYRGLLITFIELIKNTRYKFWLISSHWRAASKDVERLFDSISRLSVG
jgi:hypothetical protein